jgi:MoaA/NifB/PqqE/SkfB family radical SAM enzyme
MSFSKITSLINELNKDKIPFSVNCCLMRDNYLELDKILEQAINNGIQNISFNLIKSESSKGIVLNI